MHRPGMQHPCWGSAAGSSSKALSGVTVSPIPPVLTHALRSVPVSCQVACPQLAEKGLQSTPCPPAVPWMKARKFHMPWLPLMHFSNSHRSPLCQFSSFAVRESAEHSIRGCVQEWSPRKPSRPLQPTEAAGGQQCCEPGDQQIALKWEFRTGCGMHVWCLQGQSAHVGDSVPSYCASSPCKHPSFLLEFGACPQSPSV